MRGEDTQLVSIKSRPHKQVSWQSLSTSSHKAQPYRGSEGTCGHALCPWQALSVLSCPEVTTLMAHPPNFLCLSRVIPNVITHLPLVTFPLSPSRLQSLPSSKTYLLNTYHVPDTSLSTRVPIVRKQKWTRISRVLRYRGKDRYESNNQASI